MSKATGIVVTESTAVVSIEDQLKARLALQAESTKKLQTGTNRIGFKGGVLQIDGQIVPSGKAKVIVLATQPVRAFYDGPFNPDVAQTPACYSFDMVAPHPEAQKPVQERCEGCPNNKFGTAAVGKGKACKESARIAMVSANTDFASATIYQASVPVTSLPTVENFANRAAGAGKLVGQFIAELRVKPDAKKFFTVELEVEGMHDVGLELLFKRTDEGVAAISEPFPVMDAPAEESKKY